MTAASPANCSSSAAVAEAKRSGDRDEPDQRAARCCSETDGALSIRAPVARPRRVSGRLRRPLVAGLGAGRAGAGLVGR